MHDEQTLAVNRVSEQVARCHILQIQRHHHILDVYTN